MRMGLIKGSNTRLTVLLQEKDGSAGGEKEEEISKGKGEGARHK